MPAKGPPPADYYLAILLIFGPTSVTIAYTAELIFGLPIWLLLNRLAIQSRAAFAAAGAGMGFVVHLVMTLFALERESITLTSFTDPSNPYLYISIAAGALSALLFHTILFFPRR